MSFKHFLLISSFLDQYFYQAPFDFKSFQKILWCILCRFMNYFNASCQISGSLLFLTALSKESMIEWQLTPLWFYPTIHFCCTDIFSLTDFCYYHFLIHYYFLRHFMNVIVLSCENTKVIPFLLRGFSIIKYFVILIFVIAFISLSFISTYHFWLYHMFIYYLIHNLFK